MNVLVHHAASPRFREALTRRAPEGARVTFVDERDEPGLLAALAQADALFHVLEPLDAETLARGPRLKLVQKIGVGVNTIDLEACRRLGIGVANMPGTNTQAVVELTLALALAACRRLPTLDAAVRTGRGFPVDDATLDAACELGGRTAVLVGYGAVAARLRPVLEALGARVVVVSRTAHPGLDVRPLDDALGVADLLSLHLPLTPETRGLLSAERLARMPAGSVLVNTARGGLVDLDALTTALDRGPLRAVGLDVFPDEPVDPAHPLFRRADVVVAPHVAWRTEETLARSFDVAWDNAGRAVRGEPLRHEVVPVGRSA